MFPKRGRPKHVEGESKVAEVERESKSDTEMDVEHTGEDGTSWPGECNYPHCLFSISYYLFSPRISASLITSPRISSSLITSPRIPSSLLTSSLITS